MGLWQAEVQMVGDQQQQQQQQDLLLEAKERYRVQNECVVMLLSTIVVDKDRGFHEKSGFSAAFFYFMRIFCTVVPLSISTHRK